MRTGEVGAMRPRAFLWAAMAAGALALGSACTSGTTAECSGDAACGVPASDASEPSETSSESGPAETGAGDAPSGAEAGQPGEAGSDGGGRPETGAPEAAADAPRG